MVKTIPTLMLVLLALSNPVLGEIYRWTDADGQLHFSDEPPATQPYLTIQDKQTPVISTPANQSAEKSPAPPPTTAKRQVMRAKIASSPEQCAALLIELDTIQRTEAVFRDQNGRYHTHKSKFSQSYQGEREYLEAHERRTLVTQLTQQKKQLCLTDEDSQRRYSHALAKLTKQRECERLQKELVELKLPKYRTAESHIKEMTDLIKHNCETQNTPIFSQQSR